MKKSRWIFLFTLLLGGAAVAVWRARATTKPGGPSAQDTAGIPVFLAEVAEKDVPVWISGIGSVQAYNMVTVRPRVSGTLEKISFTEGAFVKEGDILAQIDPRPYQSALAQAKAKKAQDEAQLANAKADVIRVGTLLKTRAVSEQQMGQAEAAAGQFAALVQADQAAIDAAQLDLDFTTIRAPISGRTGVRRVDAGNVVTASQPEALVVLTQLQPISVIFNIPQLQMGHLREHMKPGAARLKVQALAEDDSVLDEGFLELVDNVVDQSNGTIRLKATFENKAFALWPGQFVSARVLVDTRQHAIVVPAETVQPGLDAPFVYVAKSDNKVEARTIEPGLSVDGFTIIEKGLKAGERVVRDGQVKLKPGALVAPKSDDGK